MINIKTNVSSYIKTEIKLWEKTVKKATLSATNKTAAQGLTFARKQMTTIYNIKKKDIVKDSRTGRLTYVKRASRENGAASIIAKGRGISLGKFGARQKKAGVSVQVKRGGRRSIIKHTFGPKIPRLGKGVFTRESIDFGISGRLPIYRLYGPGPAEMLNSRRINKAVISFAQKKYPKLYEDAFNHFKKK